MCTCHNESRWKAVVSVSGKELSSGKLIPELESDIDYKYIGILEVNDIMHTEMKDEIQKKYFWRVRQLTSLKLNGGNTIRSINSRAVSLVRCIAENGQKMNWKLWTVRHER